MDGTHLAVLWSLAVAQPLFDLLGRNAEFFAIRRSAPADIVLFAVGLVLLPPLLLLALETLAGLAGDRLRRGLHLVFVGGLAAVLALLVVERTGASTAVAAPLAAAAGAGAALLYARARAARLFLTVLAPAPALFLLLFFFNTPVRELIDGDEAHARLAADGGRAPVVMLVLDELPTTVLLGADGRIDERRYPHFAALAGDGYWFANTATVDAQTQVAVPALLTGRRPDPESLPTAEGHPDNLFTLLGRDRRLRVHESVTQLCPQDLCARVRPGFGERMRSLVSDLSVVTAHVLVPDDLRRRLPSIDAKWQDFRGGAGEGGAGVDGAAVFRRIFDEQRAARDRGELVRRFIDGVRRGPRGPAGSLDFLHVLLPHIPWEYLPDGRRYGSAEPVPGVADERWGPGQAAPKAGLQRLVAQVGFVDRLLGGLIAALRARSAYDETLVVVTADHGVSTRAGQSRRQLGPGNLADILPVPLIVKAPGQRRGRVVTTQLQTIDVLPTIASLLGAEVPWRVDGRSAFAPGAGRAVVRATTGGREAVQLRSAELSRLREAALVRQVALVGEGGFPRLRGASARELVGRPVTAASPAPAGASATLHDPAAFADVDLGGPFLPAHVTGEVRGVDAREVAIALNGRIGAVAPLIRAAGGNVFSALAPPSLLRDGRNRVEVLAVTRRGGDLRLASLLRSVAGTYRVERDAIRGPGGRSYRIEDGRLLGGVDGSSRDDDVVHLTGWAVDARASGPVDEVVGFRGDRLLFYGPPDGGRLDIAHAHGVPATADVAFGFDVPEAELQGQAQVFALSDGVASPLTWFCGANVEQEVGC